MLTDEVDSGFARRRRRRHDMGPVQSSPIQSSRAQCIHDSPAVDDLIRTVKLGITY